ncbi:MAG: UDP-N-acetylmuramoyl-L-alanyl-D-glutamate--2,6-diaminopimelate ligase [Nitrospirota bacterium]
MRLGELITALDRGADLPEPWQQREVNAVVQDSRQASSGALFVAVRGFHSDGHQFIPQAVRQGAAAVVAEENAVIEAPADTPVIRVPDSRKALARLAARFYDYPSRRLKLIGVTGTKGKTTTSYLTRSIAEAAGLGTGLIGTIEYRIGDRVYPAPNTTPESVDLQRLLAEMADLGAGCCVMEVSSHALALGRTDGCVFEAAAFTNLAPEHLDFHESMDDYFQAKLKLFTGLGADKTAVVNRDDARCSELLRNTTAKVITYGRSGEADVRPAGTIEHDSTGLRFPAATPIGGIAVASRLVGSYNVQNILAAVGLGIALGCSRGSIEDGIRRMPPIPGRMEMIDAGQPFGVIVDYAHTEDSLAALLSAVREMTRSRVITVFGCGGDRDRTKRPRMGTVALRGSDLVIVTSDNPRTEDPLAIIAEVEAGMAGGATPYLVIPDRAEAIRTAIGRAAKGDMVVLAGKGHETYQIIGEVKHHFDDREEARKAVAERKAK